MKNYFLGYIVGLALMSILNGMRLEKGKVPINFNSKKFVCGELIHE